MIIMSHHNVFPLRKNLLGLKGKANNIYFAQFVSVILKGPVYTALGQMSVNTSILNKALFLYS